MTTLEVTMSEQAWRDLPRHTVGARNKILKDCELTGVDESTGDYHVTLMFESVAQAVKVIEDDGECD